MDQQDALAAVLRGLRTAKGLGQNELPEITARYLSTLESGRGNPTLDVLLYLAAALEVSPATLMLLISSVADGVTVKDQLKRTKSQIQELMSSGATEQIYRSAGSTAPSRGRPSTMSAETLNLIRKLSASGRSHAEIAAQLGISRSTVQRNLSGK